MERGAEIASGSGKDNNVVFVAGATGNVGSRAVRSAFLACSGWDASRTGRKLDGNGDRSLGDCKT